MAEHCSSLFIIAIENIEHLPFQELASNRADLCTSAASSAGPGPGPGPLA